MCEAPAAELGRIAQAFDLPLDDAIAKVTAGEPLAIGHNVGGNQIRTEGAVTFAPGKGHEHAMPRWLELRHRCLLLASDAGLWLQSPIALDPASRLVAEGWLDDRPAAAGRARSSRLYGMCHHVSSCGGWS